MPEEKLLRTEEDFERLLRRILHQGPWPFVVLQPDRDQLLADIKEVLSQERAAVRCRLADGQADDMVRMLTGGGERRAPLKDLHQWLHGAKKVTIADPYFMHGDPKSWGWSQLADKKKKQKAEEYAKEMHQVLGSVKKIEIFHLPDPPKELRTAIKKVAWEGRNVRTFPTTEIHDRVWIRDDVDARIIGTSFGGIGNKLAFMVDLPNDDRQAFLNELQRIARA